MSHEASNPEQIETRIGAGTGPVVVGYDDSADARSAVHFAVAEASARQVPLRIVSAYTLIVSDLGLGTGIPWDEELVDSISGLAQREAAEAAEQVRVAAPSLAVSTVVEPGPAASVILEHSHDASLVVVGSRGRAGWKGMLLGGTSRQVATHCKAPTIVVRNAEPTGEFVVAGVDGSPDSVRALAFAFDYASRHQLRLLAVHTWDVPPIGAITGVPSPEPPEMVRTMANNEARAALEELAGFADRYPDVAVEHKILRGSPVKTLVAESAGAALLVIGSRGRGGFVGLMLGSVSHGVLHHAGCNVAVVTAKG
jgi:nucleotide-binding universal stress UspA family protein